MSLMTIATKTNQTTIKKKKKKLNSNILYVLSFFDTVFWCCCCVFLGILSINATTKSTWKHFYQKQIEIYKYDRMKWCIILNSPSHIAIVNWLTLQRCSLEGQSRLQRWHTRKQKSKWKTMHDVVTCFICSPIHTQPFNLYSATLPFTFWRIQKNRESFWGFSEFDDFNSFAFDLQHQRR